MDALEARMHVQLSRIVLVSWEVPAPYAMQVLRLLMHSPAARAVELRHRLLASSEATLPALFRETITPTYMMKLVNDWRAMRVVDYAAASAIEEAILTQTNAEGRWYGLEDPYAL